MNPAAFMPRDENGRFKETYDEGTPCCGVEFSDSTMPSGMIKQMCPECGNWDLIG